MLFADNSIFLFSFPCLSICVYFIIYSICSRWYSYEISNGSTTATVGRRRSPLRFAVPHRGGELVRSGQSTIDVDSYVALIIASHGSRNLARRRRITDTRIASSRHGGDTRSHAIGTIIDAVAAAKVQAVMITEEKEGGENQAHTRNTHTHTRNTHTQHTRAKSRPCLGE